MPIRWADIDWRNVAVIPDDVIPLTHADHLSVRAVNSMLAIARSRVKRRHGNPNPFYKAAGQYLDMLRGDKPKAIWAELVRKHCGLGASRASELVALARGKPVAAQRAESAARQRRRRHGQVSPGRKRAKSPVKSRT